MFLSMKHVTGLQIHWFPVEKCSLDFEFQIDKVSL